VARITFFLNSLIDFFAMYRNILGRVYTNSNLIALYTQDSHRYIITDHQCLTDTASQNQHALSPFLPSISLRILSRQRSTTADSQAVERAEPLRPCLLPPIQRHCAVIEPPIPDISHQ